ncbi:OLC1v1007315C1 [Oldenlandia corymbosa var. corymbosa]|uniref:OLC1v1007315C1 n=1 Tax=Oldenlandia corymbosa var. corymbosa TaxID=529605 RepID=A0AAV1DIZ9_OLDCO|nr:OLC1v1007315C1 [Oldenlandia corymbosa var. corymbosa]
MVLLTCHLRTFTQPHGPHSLYNLNPRIHYHPPYFFKQPRHRRSNSGQALKSRRGDFTILSSFSQPPPQQPPRTLFPGGYKRPEIKVPNVVLFVSTEEVLGERNEGLDLLDKAVANSLVGIVVLSGAGASVGRLYEAACLLKSVIRDRAYLLVDDRVDIAAAVNASGVLLSDQGLPAIVARNMMIDSKLDSVVLPLVARIVQTSNSALDASVSEGADFLIFTFRGDSPREDLVSSVFQNVKIPIFIMFDSLRDDKKTFDEASYLVKSGASGLALSLQDLKFFGCDDSGKLYRNVYASGRTVDEKVDGMNLIDVNNGYSGKSGVAGFTKIEEREKKFVETERSILLEAIGVMQRAAPLMEEISLLVDAVSQLDEPFMLVIVGEFNSGKSTVINALLGDRYLKDGVVPTTNEITFLRYLGTEFSEPEHCERHPDGQYVCYLPAPILENMIIVDTPGTNVILQRQQRLTEEFVPRADLILFVLSADRPLTESEITFLRYTQQWKKKVVFVLNKADIYQNNVELEEAIGFVEQNARKLLNVETITLYPVSARGALEAKLLHGSNAGEHNGQLTTNSNWRISSFNELEKYLFSFLDGSTSTGIERIKLKLGTPLAIAEQLLSSCQKIVREENRKAKQELTSLNKLVDGVKEYALKMKSESIYRERQMLSLIKSTQSRAVKVVESTLQLSNIDIVASYVFKGENSAAMPGTSTVRNDIIGPAVSEAQDLIGEYLAWLQSSNAREGISFKEVLADRWASFVDPPKQVQLENNHLLEARCDNSKKVLENFSVAAACKLFDQEIREVFLGTFGGLGAAGLSASLLTSVLPTTLEDLLALGICSAGGFVAISNFPARRQVVIGKVKRAGDALARELEEGMQRDLSETINNFEKYIKFMSGPYQEVLEQRLDKLSGTLDELTDIENKLQKLRIELENLHMVEL